MPKAARATLRLEDETGQAVEEIARQERRSKSAILRELLEEAIRLRRCPGILFVAGPIGRRPVIAGTGLEVWEVIAAYRECGEHFEKLHQVYDWLTPTQLRSALAYYRCYPTEIDEEIRRQEALTEEEAQRRYPHLFLPPAAPRSRRKRWDR
ncbi:MAG: DUF433 domain-containing protein [candidate division NC10 bacterium]|nr:DUF433 domain-containing protein [candidate division NC10 bacterium]